MILSVDITAWCCSVPALAQHYIYGPQLQI